MSRMARLVELRRIQEEAKALEVGKVQARITQMNQEMELLQERTSWGVEESIEDVAQPELRLPPGLYENFFQGQKWRQKRLTASIQTAQNDLAQAMTLWQEARMRLQQAEKLDQHEVERLRKEALKSEMRQMDMIASVRHWRGEGA